MTDKEKQKWYKLNTNIKNFDYKDIKIAMEKVKSIDDKFEYRYNDKDKTILVNSIGIIKKALDEDKYKLSQKELRIFFRGRRNEAEND